MGEQGRRETRQGGGEVNTDWPKSREPEKEPGERRKEREPGRALRQEPTSSRRTHSHCGKEDKKGGWEGGGEKAICAKSGARRNQRGGSGRRGDRKVLLRSKLGRIGKKGQRKWPKKWNKGPCAWDCLGRGVWGVSLSVPVCDLLSGLRG